MPAEEPGEGDGKSQHIWSLLPSFDPSTDSAREYIEKVKFIDGICPKKDRAMLAPRLAMLCRGTAWGQVKSLPSASLVDETNGVKNLLAALSTWEESSEMRTFELFERAIYKTTQRPDESSLSFVNRLQVAFNELGSTTIDEMRAFLLLRQSALTSEDKKKVLTMTQGKMDKGLIEQSMRTLATSILSGEPKKKIYPINYVEPEVKEVPETDSTVTAYYTHVDEEDVDQESIEQLANQGDADALQVQAFEKDLEDLFQEIPDMHHALISYQTARQKLVEKKKYRGFWPSGRGKGSHSFGGGGGKFGKKGKGKTSLLARIANSHCKHCGEKGHWKDECPNKPKDTVNVVTQVTSPPGLKHYEEKNDDQVIFEEFTEEAFTVIGEPGPSTIEELYHAATFEKPSEQTLEEFAKSLKSSRSSASSQDCHSHTIVVGLSKFACDFMTEENTSRSGRDKHKEGHFEKDPIIASRKTEEVDCLFAIEENTRFHAIRFLSHRLASRRAEHHLPETLLPKGKSLGECFVSKSSGEVSGGHGMAILDTGASRSVVGEDIVPALMKSLPDIIRSMVCESPSKVGFRFGNNQITYSFKQLKIPILQKGMRVWLVIEVVPKATPFLLSIHAMKTLGACIDLDTNKCFLKRLGRSLQLKQSRNGLYLVNLQELCLPSEEKTHDSLHVNTTATAESKVSSPPDLCSSSDPVDHAITEGSDRSSQGNSPECGGESEVSASDFDESTGGLRLRSSSTRRSSPGHSTSQQRGDQPTQSDRRDCTFAATTWKSIPFRPQPVHYSKLRRRVRACGFGWTTNGRNITSEEESSNRDITESQHVPNPDQSAGGDINSGNISSAGSINTSDSSCSTNGGNTTGSHGPGPGELGMQAHLLGKEAQFEAIPRGVRDRPWLRRMDPCSSKHSHASHGRFSDVLPGQRRCGTKHPPMRAQDRVLEHLMIVESEEEIKWLMACRSDVETTPHRLDLLEVYAQADSRLAAEVSRLGGRSKRFTLQDGDLSKFEGQVQLLKTIFRHQPEHIWLAPECAPWCSWNRFNMNRSRSSHDHVIKSQEEARTHLRLCALISKIQLDSGRHIHVENPGTSSMWNQPEMEPILRGTLPTFLDQCRFGLKHPENEMPLQKRTRIQTSFRPLHETLDGRLCQKDHQHHAIEGSCRVNNQRVAVSRFAAWYPRQFARTIAKSIMKQVSIEECYPIWPLVPVIDEHPRPEETETRQSKRAKKNEEEQKAIRRLEEDLEESASKRPRPEETKEIVVEDHEWKELFKEFQQVLPKSGVTVWNDQSLPLMQNVQQLVPNYEIQSIMAGKGREKFMIHPDGLLNRHTFIQKRLSHQIIDLGSEDLTGTSKRHQGRKTTPSHIMMCIFGRPKVDDEPRGVLDQPQHAPRASEDPKPDRPLGSEAIPLSSWTASAVSQSGPKFRSLSSEQQSMIKKLHNNLGHPTSEKLAKHLKDSDSPEEVVEGAKDFLCSSCVERRPPSLHHPGQLREAQDFNHRVLIDGFEWKSGNGKYKAYVLHIIDEATHFHLGRRTQRDGALAQQIFENCWSSWAGTPHRVVVDCGGEFIAEDWKQFLQKENIVPDLTAAPWQRGRIERHGQTIKEMLARIDNEENITNDSQFDKALHQCFRAKNMLSSVCGYSPEQAVLGKTSRLPASIISDEETPAHLHSIADDTGRFFDSLRLRTEARKAFLESDNSSAARRAMLRKSRGEGMNWKNGQPCMYWDKRKSPNMLEKGRWCGPAQVVLAETQSIIWITHMNRLLRCARDNLRPVSLREFVNHRPFQQQFNPANLKEMSETLQRNLRQRSGMFQFSDLSDPSVEPPAEPEAQLGSQPEEEPHQPSRRNSTQEPNRINLEAHMVPIPQDDSEYAPTTPDHETYGEQDAPQELSAGSEHPVGEEQENSLEFADSVIENALIVENADCDDIVPGDEDTLWTESVDSQLDFCQYEFDVPIHHLMLCQQVTDDHVAMLAAAAKRGKGEVKLSTLSDADKCLFKKAKEKELGCWLETSTVSKILRNKIHPDRIMTSRWILTWKEDPSQASGTKAKARLVVRGYQDPELDKVSTDSPTLSRDSRMLLLQTIASHHWTLQNFDIKTAFLRGRSDGRTLAMDPVPELRELMGMTQNEVCLLEGNAYGRVDAPLLFYREFRQKLESIGFVAHPLDGCLFLLRNTENPEVLDGILGTHVDDGIGGGNHRYDEALMILQKSLPFGSRDFRKFKFTGLDMEQLPDYSIKVSQGEYIHRISPINVPKIRRLDKTLEATASEVQELRGLCGSLQYAAVHSRPDIAAKVAFIQKSITKATVDTLLEANRVLVEAQKTADTALFVRPLSLETMTFASFGDASFASASQLRAQQGVFIMACTPELAENKPSTFSPIAWSSKQIGRVVRSTLSAEAYAMSSSLDKLNWIRCMWGFILSPSFRWQRPEVSLPTLPKALLVTDCKSLYDLVTKLATPNCEEWRTTIEVMLIKEQSQDNISCRWISTAIMLADPLTKPMDASFLRSVLQLGKFRIYDEHQTLQNNVHRKVAARWIRGMEDSSPNI